MSPYLNGEEPGGNQAAKNAPEVTVQILPAKRPSPCYHPEVGRSPRGLSLSEPYLRRGRLLGTETKRSIM